MSTLIRKLSSRKLWAAVAGVAAGIALIVNGDTTQGTAAIISAIVAYMLAEGVIDAASAANVTSKAAQVVSAAAQVISAVSDTTKQISDSGGASDTATTDTDKSTTEGESVGNS